MNHFSPKLIAQTRQYFLDKYGEDISDEQAVIYLLSLAKVYITIAKIRERGASLGSPRDPQGRGEA